MRLTNVGSTTSASIKIVGSRVGDSAGSTSLGSILGRTSVPSPFRSSPFHSSPFHSSSSLMSPLSASAKNGYWVGNSDGDSVGNWRRQMLVRSFLTQYTESQQIAHQSRVDFAGINIGEIISPIASPLITIPLITIPLVVIVDVAIIRLSQKCGILGRRQ